MNLHEIAKPILEKLVKYLKMSSAEILPKVLNLNPRSPLCDSARLR